MGNESSVLSHKNAYLQTTKDPTILYEYNCTSKVDTCVLESITETKAGQGRKTEYHLSRRVRRNRAFCHNLQK